MRNVLILTYWDVNDALIQTYTLPYVRMIRKRLPAESRIWLVTLQKSATSQELSAEGITLIPVKYTPFGIMAAWKWMFTIMRLALLIRSQKISTIHCWATPAGAIGYVLSLLTGSQLIIDSYEPHAESMVENGTWQKGSLAFRMLFWLERKQTRRAATIIATTEGMKEYAREKYNQSLHSFYVKPACVDMTLFSQAVIKNKSLLTELGFEKKIVCVYAGKFGGIYLEREIFDFLKIASDFWKDRFRVLLLSPHSQDEVVHYCNQSGLDTSIVVLKFVPHSQVPLYMGLGDFALTPVKPVPTKRYCSPIKDGEYWALGLPVIIPAHISDDSELIAKYNAGAVLETFGPPAYLSAIHAIDAILSEDVSIRYQRITSLAKNYRSMEIAEKVYESVYGRVVLPI